MTRPQRTIRGPVEFVGRGLFSGVEARLAFRPAEAGRGVVFQRTDLPGAPKVPARLECAADDPLRVTALQKGEARVRMVEHVLAAAFGLGVDNLVIEASAEEMPAGDGSAKTFVEMTRSAGIVEQADAIEVEALPFAVQAGEPGRLIQAAPCAEGLRVSYTLDYGDRFLGTQAVSFLLDEDTFADEVAPARTFVLRPEVEGFLSMGLGGGATPENLVVVEENGGAGGELRFPDECARHKVLDILGDLSLAGRPFAAHVRASRSGHAQNLELAAALRDAWSAKPR